MAREREEVLNGELGRLLMARHPLWNDRNVHRDASRTIRGSPGLKIDLLVENPGAQPVAIEAKFEAARSSLQKQVEERIGRVVDHSGETIETGISVVYPDGQTGSRLARARLRYAAHQLGTDGHVHRWPEAEDDWLAGTVDDLADAVEIVSLSEKRIGEGQEILAEGVRDAASLLESGRKKTVFGDELATALHQQPGEQTTRMAVAIIVNAFVFHYAIEGQAGIPGVDEGRARSGFHKRGVLQVWERILEINYWPIFHIARTIVRPVPVRIANRLLDKADGIAGQLLKVGATTFHDLAARMFQTLIADRKFLATFYTLPESACLLAELAVSRMDADWGNAEQVKPLRIADFACGTGTLLSAAQQAIYRRVRRAGLDDAALHTHFMENVLLGTDIMPSAVHLTASMLSSAHPGTRYDRSLVRTLPYGRDEALSRPGRRAKDTPYIGALDLLGKETGRSLFTEAGMGSQIEIGGRQMQGREAPRDTGRDFPVRDESFDLVIMNPPFTRPTNHESTTVPVPSFAGFDTSVKEQAAMSRVLRSYQGEFGHGNAGLASNFMDLAHRKLRPEGILALVLPFAFVSGASWARAREALAKYYSDIRIVSLASTGNTERAFSADTGMAECLMVAKKDPPHYRTRETTRGAGGPEKEKPVRYLNLADRPKTLLAARESTRSPGLQSGTTASFTDSGAAGLLDGDLGRMMIELRKGQLMLPRMVQAYKVPIAPLRKTVSRGLVDRDINGTGGRGAFDIRKGTGRGAPTYPALWNHDADRERCFIVQPDGHGVVRRGARAKAAETWERTASRLHHNRDFQLNSQSLAVCLTPEPSLGGRAWPNLIPHREGHEKALVIWGNSTLGLMTFWWQGSRQQQGRAMLTIAKIPDLPSLDISALDSAQLAACDALFSRFQKRPFLPANEAWRDKARQALDTALCGILGLPETVAASLNLARRKWCLEPSVHGGKNTRPTNP